MTQPRPPSENPAEETEPHSVFEDLQDAIEASVERASTAGTESPGTKTRLSESRRFIATLLSNLPGVVYRCRNDPDWTMEFLTRQVEDITGYPPEDLVENHRLSYASLIHPSDRERVWEEVQATIADGGDSFQLEYRIVTADDEERWVWEQGSPVLSTAGDLIAIEGFILDVTARKLAHEELDQRKTELFQAQKAEAVAELASACAHDLNNGLMVLEGSLSLLRDDPSPEERRTLLEDMRRATESVSTLARDLVGLARPGRPKVRDVDPRAVLQKTAQLADLIGRRTIRIRTSVPDDVPTVRADPRRLEQILLNLVINARDAMPNGGTLELRAGPADDSVEDAVAISVTDTGIGMAEQTLEHVFEPFFTTKDHGTGLGLSTSRRLVEAMGGRLLAESQPDVGSTFRILLPRGEDPE